MPPFAALRRSLAAVVVLAATSGIDAWADLNAAQEKSLAEARAYLEQADKALQIAVTGVGESPSASVVRLALTRLAPVLPAVEQAEARLGRLPKGDATVDSARGDAARIRQAAADLEARLRRGRAPAAAGGAGGVKLDHRQRETLKNAEWNVREVVGGAEAVAGIAAEVTAAKDPLRVDRRRVASAIATLESARSKARHAEGHLASLPQDGEGVAAVAAELAKGIASLDASEKIVAPVSERLVAALDPTKRPEHVADQRRLADLAAQFRDLQILVSDPRRAAERFPVLPAARAERDRILSVYALWIDQDIEEGRRIAAAAEHAKGAMDAFETAAKLKRSSLPGETDQALARVNALVEQAVAERKPAFFGGGIPQAVGDAEAALALLVVLDPEAAKERATALEALRATIVARKASLRDAIVAENEPAPDRYRGDDRADLERRAVTAWKALAPSAEVVRIVIPSDAWKRESLLRRRASEWVLEDASRLQVQLLVRFDATTLVVRPVNLVKDHTAGDAVSAYPMDDARQDPDPSRLVLSSKLR